MVALKKILLTIFYWAACVVVIFRELCRRFFEIHINKRRIQISRFANDQEFNNFCLPTSRQSPEILFDLIGPWYDRSTLRLPSERAKNDKSRAEAMELRERLEKEDWPIKMSIWNTWFPDGRTKEMIFDSGQIVFELNPQTPDQIRYINNTCFGITRNWIFQGETILKGQDYKTRLNRLLNAYQEGCVVKIKEWDHKAQFDDNKEGLFFERSAALELSILAGGYIVMDEEILTSGQLILHIYTWDKHRYRSVLSRLSRCKNDDARQKMLQNFIRLENNISDR